MTQNNARGPRRRFGKVLPTEGVFFTATVLVEMVWVLRTAYKQDRTAITVALVDFSVPLG
ncbi:MAG: hypothetical protein R3A48_19410 [Polyangiales bacterium]